MEQDSIGAEESRAEGGTLEALAWGFRAIAKRWPIVLAFLLLGVGIALGYSKSVPNVYEAATLLEFDPDVIKPLGNKTDPLVGWSAIWDTREYYETQYRLIQSDRVLSTVARDLGLQNDPDFLGYRPTAPVPLEGAIGMVRGSMTVEPVKGSRLVYIKFKHGRPAQARRLSEAVARAYIAQNLEKMVSATGDTVVWLSGQLDHFKHELEQTENALHEFKKENDLPSSTLDDLSKMIRMEMQEYDSALTRTRLRRQELTARHKELSKITTDTPDQIPASELLSNGHLAGLRKQYQDAERERAELIAEGKGENYPAVKKADEKIALSRTALVNEIQTIQRAVERDVAIIQQQEQGEAGLYEESRKKAVDLNLKELEFHRLDRLRAQNEKLYAVLLEQLKEADLRRMMNTNNIRLIDLPTEPKSPIFPRVGLNAGIGALVGLLLGIALAFIRETLDNTIKTPEDLEKRFGVTFLGLLPEMAGDERVAGAGSKKNRRAREKSKRALPPELIVHEDPTSGIAEAARSLRTNLTFMNPDKPYKRLLVTSAAPSEGKTTVAVSIAVSLAQSGLRVCILDCDLRRPRLHRIFGRAGDVGLMNVVVGEATIDEAAKPTIVPNLSCIPCGPIPPSSADVVGSEKFRHVLDELATKFDRIVLDSPPVVAVTDSAILSTVVDGVVVVVRALKTTFGLARTGLRQLRDVDAPIAGAVLNAVNLNKNQYYYEGYYYYRRDGYGPLQAAEQQGAPPPSETASPPPN
ncbi:MAG: polysaccharide biosynthesis tyrosine autokinase [Labilithrix sp.]|nr:polysaccharide biosynthesis tyrosine autokinase [Labilithrix sp.]MCW5814746.1 polysaccharide biosynthesis tyrosine autokinase [Labilithrix sp.]